MLRRQCCSSSFCLFFFLLFRLQRVLLASLPTNPHYVSCSENIRCGNRKDINITYPFRLVHSPSYCGYPGYELNCNVDEEPAQLTIKLGEDVYAIQKIFYEERIIQVVDSYFMRTDCPSSFTNTTVNSALFNYTRTDSNITVYVNCSFPFTPPELLEIPCLGNAHGPNKSYYKVDNGPSTFMENLIGSCDLAAAVAVYNELNFNEMLKGGFGLTWNSRMDWCQDCEHS